MTTTHQVNQEFTGVNLVKADTESWDDFYFRCTNHLVTLGADNPPNGTLIRDALDLAMTSINSKITATMPCCHFMVSCNALVLHVDICEAVQDFPPAPRDSGMWLDRNDPFHVFLRNRHPDGTDSVVWQTPKPFTNPFA